MAKADLTAQRLRELLSYNPDTGAFIRLASRLGNLVGRETGSVAKVGYVYIELDRRRYLSHRLAWLYMTGTWPTAQIDHINGNRTDNRWCNLRNVTQQVDIQNRRSPKPNSASGLLGVHWSGVANKWQSQIRVNGKRLHLGYFPDKHDAHEAYLQAKRLHHAGNTL